MEQGTCDEEPAALVERHSYRGHGQSVVEEEEAEEEVVEEEEAADQQSG